MGVPLSNPETEVRGNLEPSRTEYAHKCLRTEDGQHYCRCSHKQDGGYKVTNTESDLQNNPGILDVQGDHSYCRIPPRMSEHHSRLREQEFPRNEYKQLEIESANISTDMQSDGGGQIGPFCRSLECSSASLCELEKGPISSVNGCIFDDLGEREVGVCISPFCIIPRCLSKIQRGRGDNLDNSCMAISTILPNIVANDNSRTDIVTTTEKFTSVSKWEGTPNDKQWNPKTSGLENFRESAKKAWSFKPSYRAFVLSMETGYQVKLQ